MNFALSTMESREPEIFISVIIPVYNDARRLKRCLEVLDKQTCPGASYEVIVVDNGSNENISAVTDQFPRVVLCHEPRPGSYAARNKGISVAEGKVFAFTDSDCIPASDWIEKGIEQVRKHPDCGLVAGKVNMFFRDPRCLTAAELYEKMFAFDQQDNVQKKKFGVTANLFTRKQVFGDVGLFNAALKSGGDLEWGNRVSGANYELIYADDVCVEHPARHSLCQLYKKRVRIQGGLNAINNQVLYSLSDALVDLKKTALNTLHLLKCFLHNQPPSEKFENARQKMQYLVVISYVRLISIFEKWHLHIGGKPHR